MSPLSIETGQIEDTSKTPPRVLEGTRYRKLEDLERVVGILDLHQANLQMMKKKNLSSWNMIVQFLDTENYYFQLFSRIEWSELCLLVNLF